MKERLVALVLAGLCPLFAADEYAMLQKALDKALEAGGTVVFVSDGVHTIRKPLKIHSNTTLELSPRATIRREFDNTADYYPMIEIADDATNVTIRGGTLDGNGDEYCAEPFDILFGVRFKNLTVENVAFLDVYGFHAIDFAASEDILIRNCKFLGLMPRPKETHPREAIQVDPYFDKGGKPSRRIRIEGCLFAASSTPGFGAPPVGVGNHYAGRDAAGKFHSDIRIIGNTFEGCAYAGLRVCNFENTIIANNAFIDCAAGVSVMPKKCAEGATAGGGDGFVVIGNVFKGASTGGIHFEPLSKGQPVERSRHRQIVISANVFKDSPAAPAVSLWWCGDVAITGNVATEVREFVRMTQAERVSMTGNSAPAGDAGGLMRIEKTTTKTDAP